MIQLKAMWIIMYLPTWWKTLCNRQWCWLKAATEMKIGKVSKKRTRNHNPGTTIASLVAVATAISKLKLFWEIIKIIKEESILSKIQKFIWINFKHLNRTISLSFNYKNLIYSHLNCKAVCSNIFKLILLPFPTVSDEFSNENKIQIQLSHLAASQMN